MASECFVYFIQSGKGGPVKIGTARCVKTRIAQLQTGNPVGLILLLTLQGNSDEERMRGILLRIKESGRYGPEGPQHEKALAIVDEALHALAEGEE